MFINKTFDSYIPYTVIISTIFVVISRIENFARSYNALTSNVYICLYIIYSGNTRKVVHI